MSLQMYLEPQLPTWVPSQRAVLLRIAEVDLDTSEDWAGKKAKDRKRGR